MSRCAHCGFEMNGDFELCPHHHMTADGDWAAANRIMCDLLHRGKVPPRLSPEARESELISADG